MQSVHGGHFSRRKWDQFIKSRAAPGSKVSFAEIEVELCNIPCLNDVIEEEEEERRRKAGKSATLICELVKEIMHAHYRLVLCIYSSDRCNNTVTIYSLHNVQPTSTFLGICPISLMLKA